MCLIMTGHLSRASAATCHLMMCEALHHSVAGGKEEGGRLCMDCQRQLTHQAVIPGQILVLGCKLQREASNSSCGSAQARHHTRERVRSLAIVCSYRAEGWNVALPEVWLCDLGVAMMKMTPTTNAFLAIQGSTETAMVRYGCNSHIYKHACATRAGIDEIERKTRLLRHNLTGML